MLKLIALIRDLQQKTGLSISEIVQIVSQLVSLGAPPSLEDKVAFRTWVTALVGILEGMAAETPVEIDDKALGYLSAVVESDAAWEVFWQLLGLLDDGEAIDSPAAMALAGKLREAEPVELDPATIMLVIQAIVSIIRLLRRD